MSGQVRLACVRPAQTSSLIALGSAHLPLRARAPAQEDQLYTTRRFATGARSLPYGCAVLTEACLQMLAAMLATRFRRWRR